jgi:hemerythrin superfamily protein
LSKKEIIRELKNLKEILSSDGINAKRQVKERIERLLRMLENKKG